MYAPLQFANLFDFHADAFATPLLLGDFAALFAGRVGWAVAWAALLILVKEDIALVAACFGVYVAAVHRRPVGLALAGGAAAAFVQERSPDPEVSVGSLQAYLFRFGEESSHEFGG